MLSVKQGGIKYHFLSLWYDSAWDWTQVSRAIGEHSNREANVRYLDMIVFNWNHFEMRLLNLRINFFIYCELFVLILVLFVLLLLSLRLGQISPLAFFRWFLRWPRIGMLSLVTVSPVITACHSCCLSHHVFDQLIWIQIFPFLRLVILPRLKNPVCPTIYQ